MAQLELEPGPARGMFQYRADNAVRFIVVPSPGHRIIRLSAVYRQTNRAGLGALVRMIAMMAGHGTTQCPGISALERRQQELYGLGLNSTSGSTGRACDLAFAMRSVAPETVPEGMRYFREALSLFVDFISDPVMTQSGRRVSSYPAETFSTEKEMLLLQLKAESDDKDRYAFRQALKMSYPTGHPEALPPVGTIKEVATVTPAEAARGLRKIFARAPLTVVLSGPISPKKHLAPVVEAFQRIHRSSPLRSPPKNFAMVPSAGTKPRQRTERRDAEQAQVVLTYATRRCRGKDWLPAVLYNAVLGGSASSRLFRSVREEKGLAYSVGSTISGTSGLLVTMAGTGPSSSAQARDTMRAEIKKLATEGVGSAELEVARTVIREGLAAAMDSLPSRVEFLLSQETMRGNRIMTVEQTLDALSKVTPAEVNRVAADLTPLAAFTLLPNSPVRRPQRK